VFNVAAKFKKQLQSSLFFGLITPLRIKEISYHPGGDMAKSKPSTKKILVKLGA